MYPLVNVQNKLCGTQVGGINMDQATYRVIDGRWSILIYGNRTVK